MLIVKVKYWVFVYSKIATMEFENELPKGNHQEFAVCLGKDVTYSVVFFSKRQTSFKFSVKFSFLV